MKSFMQSKSGLGYYRYNEKITFEFFFLMDFKHLNNLNFNRSLIFKDSNFRQSPYKLSDWQMFLEKRIRFWP